jgi:hypothetical protein
MSLHREEYSLTTLAAPGFGVPPPGGRFASVARLDDETTVACELRYAPAGGETKGGFRLIAIEGDFALDSIGIVAAVAAPLAAAGVSLFAFSVWNADAFLVTEADLANALRALADAGHAVTVI